MITSGSYGSSYLSPTLSVCNLWREAMPRSKGINLTQSGLALDYSKPHTFPLSLLSPRSKFRPLQMFAEQLQSRMKASGFDITVRAGDEQSEELVLDSDIFKDTAARVQFLHDVLPNWRHDLCTAGFRQVRLIRGGIFSTGDAYSIGCK